MSKKVLRILISTVICFCLISNILFSVQYFYYYLKFQEEYTFATNWSKGKNTLKIPYIVLEWIRNTSQIIFVTGIPLVFAVNYFLTGRWRELKVIIQDLRQEIVVPSTYYKRCRISCLILTVLFLTVGLFKKIKFIWINHLITHFRNWYCLAISIRWKQVIIIRLEKQKIIRPLIIYHFFSIRLESILKIVWNFTKISPLGLVLQYNHPWLPFLLFSRSSHGLPHW